MKQLGENQSKHENKDICTFGNQNILPVFAVIANFCHSVEDEKQTRFKKKKKKSEGEVTVKISESFDQF